MLMSNGNQACGELGHEDFGAVYKAQWHATRHWKFFLRHHCVVGTVSHKVHRCSGGQVSRIPLNRCSVGWPSHTL